MSVANISRDEEPIVLECLHEEITGDLVFTDCVVVHSDHVPRQTRLRLARDELMA